MATTITRTGYTAELGYDLYVGIADAEALFAGLLEAGADDGLLICGSCALDRRRVEAAILNVGQDFDWATNPFELGLGRMVDFNKTAFHGKTALEKVASQGPLRRIVGLRSGADQPLLQTADVFSGDAKAGIVTSSTLSSSLGAWIALAMLDVDASAPGHRVQVVSGDGTVEAEVVRTPFLDPGRALSRA